MLQNVARAEFLIAEVTELIEAEGHKEIYMTHFLNIRNLAIRKAIQSDEWRKFL